VTDDERRASDLAWLYGSEAPPARPHVPSHPTTAAGSSIPAPGVTSAPAPRPEPVVPAPRIQPRIAATGAADERVAPVAGSRLGRGIRRHPVRWTLVVVALLVLAWIVWLTSVPLLIWSRVATVDVTVPAVAGARHAPGTTILLAGSDSRDDLTQEERDKLGGPVDLGRTDTVIILYIPSHGEPALISLPRDSYLPIPGHGKNKLNAAYAFGGAPLLVQTVEQATGLVMDGYLEVNMGGFANLVDVVGGVEVCLDKAIQDADSQLDLPAGCQTLGGDQALAYARMRKADPLGDLGRVQRQRELIGKIAHKLATPRTVLDPARYWRVGSAAADTLRRGQDTGAVPALRAGLAMAKIGTGRGLSLTVPISNPNATTPAGSSVLWDDAAARELFDDIAAGNTAALTKFAK